MDVDTSRTKYCKFFELIDLPRGGENNTSSSFEFNDEVTSMNNNDELKKNTKLKDKVKQMKIESHKWQMEARKLYLTNALSWMVTVFVILFVWIVKGYKF